MLTFNTSSLNCKQTSAEAAAAAAAAAVFLQVVSAWATDDHTDDKSILTYSLNEKFSSIFFPPPATYSCLWMRLTDTNINAETNTSTSTPPRMWCQPDHAFVWKQPKNAPVTSRGCWKRSVEKIWMKTNDYRDECRCSMKIHRCCTMCTNAWFYFPN